MKLSNHTNDCRALTLIEVLVVMAVLFVLAAMFLPMLARSGHRGSGHRIKCVNNLKQIGLAYRIFAEDHDGRFPYEQTNTLAFQNDRQAWAHYLTMSNELGSAKMLICPGDSRRIKLLARSADPQNFSRLLAHGNDAISYFVGLDARGSLTNAMLGGDWNIGSSAPLRASILTLQTNDSIWWTTNLNGHVIAGNVLFADGSVWQTTSAALKEVLRASPLETNRLLMPMP